MASNATAYGGRGSRQPSVGDDASNNFTTTQHLPSLADKHTCILNCYKRNAGSSQAVTIGERRRSATKSSLVEIQINLIILQLILLPTIKMTSLYDPATFELLDNIQEVDGSHQCDSPSTDLDSFDFDFEDDEQHGTTPLSIDAFVPGNAVEGATTGFPDLLSGFTTSNGEPSSAPDISHLVQEPHFYRPSRNSNKRVLITPTPEKFTSEEFVRRVSDASGPSIRPLPLSKRRRVSTVSLCSESPSLEETDEYSRALAKLTESMKATEKTRQMLLLHRRLMNEGHSVEDMKVRATEYQSAPHSASSLEDQLANIRAFLSGTRCTLTDGLEESRRQLNALGGMNRDSFVL